jgi:two-component sensor histidine kinase
MTSSLAGRRILLVEDEVMVAWALEDMLSGLGCAVVGPAARIDQALELIETINVDAAVLDINLNGEEGYPVADALRARGVPFIISTGYHKSGLQEAYRSYPMLQKPYQRSKLGNELVRLFDPGKAVIPEPRSINPVWDANRLRTATDAAEVGLWSWNIDADDFTMDERSHRLWGVGDGRVTFEDLSAKVHPDDVRKVRTAFTSARKVLGVYEMDFRILHSDEIHWISSRGMGDNLGAIGRIMFGVFLDITDRMRAEEARELLASEMGHRVKNLFAIALALTRISARTTMTSAEMSLDLSGRLDALHKAHQLVRPSEQAHGQLVMLGELLEILLAPYLEAGRVADRICIAAPDIIAGGTSITTMALIIHELATNSLKYGALSTETGTLDVNCLAGNGVVTMTWTEKSELSDAAVKNFGFGSQLIEKSVSGQLAGTISYDWKPAGLVVTLRMSKERLAV